MRYIKGREGLCLRQAPIPEKICIKEEREDIIVHHHPILLIQGIIAFRPTVVAMRHQDMMTNLLIEDSRYFQKKTCLNMIYQLAW